MGARLLCVVAWALAGTAAAAAQLSPDDTLARLGTSRGICMLVGDEAAGLAVEIAARSRLVVLAQLGPWSRVQSLARQAEKAGLLGRRVFVAFGRADRLALADDLADALVAGPDARVPRSEVLRVLRPGGRALVGDQVITKPVPRGVDDWTHHYHGPDNNPQSADRLARAPYLTQFIAEPRYAPAPQCAVAAGGRLFAAFGHIAWHRREEAALDTLFAFNAYNGTVLWKRSLPSGLMVDRSLMVATPRVLYLAEGRSCKVLDAATGAEIREITVPSDLGTFWKWIALEDGTLYALVGEPEPPDPVRRWRRTAHGWPWGGISDGYNKGPYRWGFGSTLLALDPRTGGIRWQHREPQGIDSRSLSMKAGRIFFCRFGSYIACLDTHTGKQLWRRTAANDPEVFQAIGPYRPGHGYIGGWKSTAYTKCSDRALYFVGPQVNWLTALSAADGHVLWRHKVKDLHLVIRPDALYVIGPQKTQGETKKLDPLTGRVLATYQVCRRACTRSTGTPDGILFRAPGGSCRLDLPSGRLQWISPFRPSCHVGVIIANGHLYWIPWVCDCNLQLFGLIACRPAGGFDFEQPATRDRLESFLRRESPAPFRVEVADWPTYRADNSRSGTTVARVPEKIAPRWSIRGPVEPTAPVAAGGMVFWADAAGTVRAADAATGQVRWAAHTGGRVFYPPTIAGAVAYVGSGDGHVYAFDAPTGRLLWRFRAAPVEDRIPVYGRLMSRWPVASGVLVADGVAYFAAGITDYDGTHLYALDASTGRLKWQNNSAGHLDRQSRRGVACQGELLLYQGKLYLAGGNAVSPAVFDARTGRCLSPPPRGMGTHAPRGRELRVVGGQVRTWGQPLYSAPEYPVYERSCRWADPTIEASNAQLALARTNGRWELVARRDGQTLWRQPLGGEPVRWGIAVDAAGRIFVALRDGRIRCFAAPTTGP